MVHEARIQIRFVDRHNRLEIEEHLGKFDKVYYLFVKEGIEDLVVLLGLCKLKTTSFIKGPHTEGRLRRLDYKLA